MAEFLARSLVSFPLMLVASGKGPHTIHFMLYVVMGSEPGSATEVCEGLSIQTYPKPKRL